jgi:hypothetical protein
MITKQEIIDTMINLSMEFKHPGDNDDEYYLLAELYRSLDQYCYENNIDICAADRWI